MVIAKALAWVGALCCIGMLLTGVPVTSGPYLLAYMLMMWAVIVGLFMDNRRLRRRLNPSIHLTDGRVVPATVDGELTIITIGGGGGGCGRSVSHLS